MEVDKDSLTVPVRSMVRSGSWIRYRKFRKISLLCRFSFPRFYAAQGMAAAFPNVARTGGVLKAEYSIKFLLVAIIFFVSGLTLPLRNLVGHIY